MKKRKKENIPEYLVIFRRKSTICSYQVFTKDILREDCDFQLLLYIFLSFAEKSKFPAKMLPQKNPILHLIWECIFVNRKLYFYLNSAERGISTEQKNLILKKIVITELI